MTDVVIKAAENTDLYMVFNINGREPWLIGNRQAIIDGWNLPERGRYFPYDFEIDIWVAQADTYGSSGVIGRWSTDLVVWWRDEEWYLLPRNRVAYMQAYLSGPEDWNPDIGSLIVPKAERLVDLSLDAFLESYERV